MTSESHKSNLVLFPLCDKSGVLLHVLKPEPKIRGVDNALANRRGTRPDAVIFAWVLDLPVEIDSVDAARAVLDATRHQVHRLNAYQRSVVAELAKHIKKEETVRAGTTAFGGVARRFKNARRTVRQAARPPQNVQRIKSHDTQRFVCLTGGRTDKESS